MADSSATITSFNHINCENEKIRQAHRLVIFFFLYQIPNEQAVLFSSLFLSHICVITEVRSNHSFSQCELIMRQAVIKMFALIVCRVIRGGLQCTREINVGHAWRKELGRPTISQLPTTVKRAEKYERTVGRETQQDKPLALSHSLSLSLSVSFALSLFASNHVTQPQRNASYIGGRFKRSGKEKNSKERIAEGSKEAVGVVWFPLCLYRRTTWQGARQHCSDTQVQTHTHLTTPHMLT